MSVSRRNMLKMAVGGALMPWAPGVNVAFGADGGTQRNMLVYIFMRFGMDGLQMLAPAEDSAYRANRRTIGLPTTGVNAARPIGTLDGTQFFMHRNADQLRLMFSNKTLAFIHAAGNPTELRSHFEVQENFGWSAWS